MKNKQQELKINPKPGDPKSKCEATFSFLNSLFTLTSNIYYFLCRFTPLKYHFLTTSNRNPYLQMWSRHTFCLILVEEITAAQ